MTTHGVDRSGAAGGTGAVVTSIDLTVVDAKGDLIVGTANDAVDNLAVGANDRMLMADSAQTTGIKWATPDQVLQAAINGATAETAPATGDLVGLSDVSATAGRKMTLENALKVINSLTADLSPDKTADYLLAYDASASGVKRVIMQEFPLPRSYLAGGTLSNNGTDATNDIDVTAGEARNSTNVVNIRWSALTGKQLDVAWAVGSSAGMLDTGAIANGTYHIYAIRKDSDGTGDILASTSASAPTMPTGYTYFRRVGSILRESAAIVAFVQDGDLFLRTTPISDVAAANPGTAAVTRTLSVPTGVRVRAVVNHTCRDSAAAGSYSVYLSDLAVTDQAPALGAAPGSTGGTAQIDERFHFQIYIRTSTSAQIRSRILTSNATTTLYIVTVGWIDTRGRDD